MIALRHDYFLQDVYLISHERSKVKSIHNLTFLHLCWRDLKWLICFTVFFPPNIWKHTQDWYVVTVKRMSQGRIHVGYLSLWLLCEMRNVEQGSVDQALCLDFSSFVSFLTSVFRILLLTKSNSTVSHWSSQYSSGAPQLPRHPTALTPVAALC